jgi:hypothetical protein
MPRKKKSAAPPPAPVEAVKHRDRRLMTTDPGDLVLDPTCGSGTTAYVAEQWGRRWITIDTSRVALALARTRLMAARFPYYLPADSLEGRKKEAEVSGGVHPRREGDEDGGGEPRRSPSDFVTTILDNLRAAGVRNTKKGEKLTFDRLDPHPGEFLQAEGAYTEAGKSKRVAVCVGPEFGTLSPDLLQGAAREAHRGIGFDLLLVCGFAFDPHVAEEGKVVEVRGMDVFDPTTGEIPSSGPEDIACRFLNTDYNGDSFFVRHAYFLGGGNPYEKLKRALKAEVDEAGWR